MRGDAVRLHCGHGPARVQFDRSAVQVIQVGGRLARVVAVDQRQPGCRTDRRRVGGAVREGSVDPVT